MELSIKTFGTNAAAGTVSLSDVTFNREFNEALVHQVVNAYLAGDRQGTKAQKNRAAVSGGGAKPFNQKGSGRARAGTTRGPLWRTGGRTFAACPRDFTQKVNRKMYRAAMQCILSELIRQDRLLVLEKIELEAPKTRTLFDKLKALDVAGALIVLDDIDENVYLSARNLKNVDVTDVQGVSPVDMLKYTKVIVSVAAIKQLEELLG